jgi:hypothetical protein
VAGGAWPTFRQRPSPPSPRVCRGVANEIRASRRPRP